MCGLYGAIAAPGHDVRGWTPAFEEMDRRLRHRGPDDCGFYTAADYGVALGHRRLSIIDVSAAGRQPLWNEDGTIALLFNGEIYNFRTLRQELERDHQFKSGTDSEVIVHGYEAWGEGVLDRLDGMFAFALWDAGDRSVLLARDRIGKKPLYYAETSAGVLFASELRALLAASSLPRRVDPTGVRDYLTYGYVPSPKTLIEGVRKVAPGHAVTVRDGRIRDRTYWRLPVRVGDRREPRSTSLKQVRHLVEAAVTKRLISDVPIAALLSGGIDSTIVVSSMARASRERVRTFTVGFAAGVSTKTLNQDLTQARETARRLGTDHHELFLSGERENLRRLLNESVRITAEPNANPTTISTFAIAELVRDAGTKVVLTGDGGDELFGGYPRYLYDRWTERVGRIPRPIRAMAGAALARLPARQRVERGRRLLQKAEEFTTLNLGGRYLAWRQLISVDEQAAVASHDVLSATTAYDPATIADTAMSEIEAPTMRDRLSYADLKLWVADESNLRLDRGTMASSVEARCPFLDAPLAEYALSLPYDVKVPAGRTKALLRDAFADVLPADVAAGIKRGFQSPARWWVQETLAEVVDDVLTPARMAAAGVLNPTGVMALRTGHEAVRRAPKKIWTLLILQLWAEEFLA
jgi:asparagine synthase (glutamine-hydrolysing)